MIEKELIKKEVEDMWSDFKESVLYKDRFFISHPMLDIISQYIMGNILVLPIGSIYYRARIIDDNARKDHMLYKCYNEKEGLERTPYLGKNQFRGLSKEASFVPPDNKIVRDGRANPKFVKYLYVAEEAITAIFEVRPLLTDAVNLAEIEIKSTLSIANIAVALDLDDESFSKEKYLLHHIQNAFSYATNNSDDYIPTQIISEYIKKLGYDGIRYNSALHRGGVNVTIYNYDKCEVVSSRDFRIENIKMTVRAAIGSDSGINKFWWIVDNVQQEIPI